MSCCARDSGSKLSKRSRASVWSKQLLRPRSDPIFHILSCLCNWWDFAHEDLLKQSRGRRGNLTTQHYPLGFASFVKHSSFGKQITRAQNPTRLLLVCVSVGLTPLLGMRGIFRVRYWKFTSLCRWTLQPGNIRSDPIRQNKSCSPVPRGCVGGGGGAGGSQMERSGMPVVRTRNWIRRTRNSSLKTELKAFFNCYLLQCTIKDTLTAKNSSVFSRTP